MKLQSRLISLIISAVIIISALPSAAFAAEAHDTADIIVFGSYPQSEVRDKALISSLDALAADWISYGYYGGTGIYDDGKMTSSDYMRYADVEYGGNKYRGVTFDEDRIIVLASKNINVSSTLKDLFIKHSDPYLIIDVHNYSPMEFTHQGAEWIDGYEKAVPYTADVAKAFAQAVEIAAEYEQKHGTKVVVGEIGVYLKQVDEKAVNAFLTDAVNCLKENNLPYAYWEYCAGFGAYDLEARQWKAYVTDALLK